MTDRILPPQKAASPVLCVCDGSYACPAVEHIHGCFSDNPCTHEPRVPTRQDITDSPVVA